MIAVPEAIARFGARATPRTSLSAHSNCVGNRCNLFGVQDSSFGRFDARLWTLRAGGLKRQQNDSAGSMISGKCAYWSNSSSLVPWPFLWARAPIGIHLFAGKKLTTQKQFEASRRLLQKLKEMPFASPITWARNDGCERRFPTNPGFMLRIGCPETLPLTLLFLPGTTVSPVF